MASQKRVGWFWKNYSLVVILALGALHGLLYLFLVPPWQHYDEPSHFEYAWLIANRPALLQEGNTDEDMRRQVALSMLEHNFFRDLDFLRPDLTSSKPVWIGLPALRHPPAYYWLVSLPLRLFKSADVTLQLYVSRFVSWLLFLVTLATAWAIMTEIVPSGHSLRWMVPATIALLPPFTDMMTAVNNDVGATAAFSIFLWGCVYLLRRGLSFWGFICCAAFGALALWTKTTTFVGLPLFVLVILLVLFRKHTQLVWISLGLGVLVGLLAILSWGDATFWYRYTSQEAPTRISTPFAPVASNSFQLQILSDGSPVPGVRQVLPLEQVANLKGKTVTLGAWMWATQSLRGFAPVLWMPETGQRLYKEIVLGQVPNFYAFSVEIPKNSTLVEIALEQPGGPPNITVFYNGLVFAEGQYPLDASPEFDNSGGTRGIWGGRPFLNLIRNPFAAQAWFHVRPWADALVLKAFSVTPSLVFSSIGDWQGTGWYYLVTFDRLFRTFWAGFGWGRYSVQDPGAYFFILITVAAGIGVAATIWRRGRDLNWSICLFFLIGIALIWGSALVRGLGETLFSTGYIPVARYGYPMIIPTVLVLCAGWTEVLRYVEKRFRVPRTILGSLYLALFVAFDGYALYSMVNFFTKG